MTIYRAAQLAGLPPGAQKINSAGAPQSSLLMLSGMYVDADGIIYTADGTVDEAATAAWAREVAAGRITAPYFDWGAQAAQQKQDSIAQNSQADATRAYLDALESNIWTTAAAVPGQLVNVVQQVASTSFAVGKWAVVGLVAWAALEAMGRVPRRSSRSRA